MADVIANLVAVISADVRGFTNDLAGAKKDLGDFGRTLTTSLTLPIVGFGIAAIKSFSDSETELAQLNAVLKSTKGIAGVTAKSAIDLSKALQRVTRYSDEDVLSAENLLLTFTNISKNIFPDTTKVALDMSTALGQDLKSSAIQLGKALQDPITGVTALRRVGVNFTQAQMDMIKSLVDSGNLLGAQKMILQELQKEFGGSAVAAGSTFAGALDKLKNKFDDFLEVVGEKMAPALSKGIDFLSGLIDKLGTLSPGTIELGIAAAAAVAALGPLLTILGNIGIVIGLILSPIGLLLGAIVLVGALAIQHFGGLDNLLKAAFQSAIQLGFIIGYYVTQAFIQLGAKISGVAIYIQSVVKGIIDAYNAAVKILGLQGGDKPTRQSVENDVFRTAMRNSGASPLDMLQAATGAGRAFGGHVAAGMAYPVGERGPETLVMGNQSGHVVPNGGGGPQMLTIILQAHNFEEHIVYNLANAHRGGAS